MLWIVLSQLLGATPVPGLPSPVPPPVPVPSNAPRAFEIIAPGIAYFCRTGPSLHVRALGTQLWVSGGRLCESGEKPTLVLDTATCTLREGQAIGLMSMDCSLPPGDPRYAATPASPDRSVP